MIIRIALFLTLLAIFYFYCREDNTTHQFRGPNDVNMIDVPAEIFPDNRNHTDPTTNIRGDSSLYWLTALRPRVDGENMSDDHSTQNN